MYQAAATTRLRQRSAIGRAINSSSTSSGKIGRLSDSEHVLDQVCALAKNYGCDEVLATHLAPS
jgi:hypothetical protein